MYIGRYEVCDTCEELSTVAESTCFALFHEFVTKYSEKNFKDKIKLPEGDLLKDAMEYYRKMGVSGAFGSADCTYIHTFSCLNARLHIPRYMCVQSALPKAPETPILR